MLSTRPGTSTEALTHTKRYGVKISVSYRRRTRTITMRQTLHKMNGTNTMEIQRKKTMRSKTTRRVVGIAKE
jgi:hypothetical protein